MEQVYKTFVGNTDDEQTRKATVSRKTFKQSIAYQTFNNFIKHFFADDDELETFDVLRDVRTVELVTFLSVIGMGVFGTLFFGSLYIIGMFS